MDEGVLVVVIQSEKMRLVKINGARVKESPNAKRV